MDKQQILSLMKETKEAKSEWNEFVMWVRDTESRLKIVNDCLTYPSRLDCILDALRKELGKKIEEEEC